MSLPTATIHLTSSQPAVVMLLPPSAIFAEAVELAHQDEERDGGHAQRRPSRPPRGRRHRHHTTRSAFAVKCAICDKSQECSIIFRHLGTRCVKGLFSCLPYCPTCP